MSLTAQVNAKMASKRDPSKDKEAQAWIEAIIGEKFPAGTYEDALRDGIILIKLMNKLNPGCIPKYIQKGGDFQLRDNLTLFTKAAGDYGVPNNELFQSVDLFEKKNIAQVTICVFALGREAQRKKFNGPTLGPKPAEENKREFTEEQLRAGEATIGLQAGFNKGASQAGQNFGLSRHM